MSQAWTPARDAELKRLWPIATASEIAKSLCTTRNAVIGRYHRLDGRYDGKIAASAAARRAETQRRRDALCGTECKIIDRLKDAIGSGVARDEAIRRARYAGARLCAIGAAMGMTRERVRQIVAEQKESV